VEVATVAKRKAAAKAAPKAGASAKAKAPPKARAGGGARGNGDREPAGSVISLADFRRIPAFAGMSEEDSRMFLDLMTERPVARGEPIFREGEVGDGLYVILGGRVSIVKKNAKGGEREVALLEKHEVFGEMDLISDRPHTSGAKGAEGSLLLFLPRGEFQRLLLERHPGATSMVIYFARMLAGRLDHRNQEMMSILEGERKPADTEFADFKRRLLREWAF
jgi:CRP/FNR family transcriptional regulator, cyclic AMP receptor protein